MLKKYCSHAEAIVQDEKNQQMKKFKATSFKWLNLSTVLHLPEAEVETVDEGEVRPFPMTTERKLILAGNVIKWATLLETA